MAGETGNVEAKLVVACTLVRDVERGWGRWNLRGRWYGWKRPSALDVQAVYDALSGGCGGVPVYRYVGSETDYLRWKAKGLVDDGDVVDRYGSTVGVR